MTSARVGGYGGRLLRELARPGTGHLSDSEEGEKLDELAGDREVKAGDGEADIGADAKEKVVL